MIFFVLLDTNVILDFAMKRGDHYLPARKIMNETVEGRLIAYVSASQITDIYYFLEKGFSHEKAVQMITDLIESVRVIRVDEDTIETAINSGMPDLEDAVQAAAAKNVHVDIVVTRDTMGFHNSGLQVYSPKEFLETLDLFSNLLSGLFRYS